MIAPPFPIAAIVRPRSWWFIVAGALAAVAAFLCLLSTAAPVSGAGDLAAIAGTLAPSRSTATATSPPGSRATPSCCRSPPATWPGSTARGWSGLPPAGRPSPRWWSPSGSPRATRP